MSATVPHLQKQFIRHTSALRGYLLAMVPDPNTVWQNGDTQPGTHNRHWMRRRPLRELLCPNLVHD